MFPILNSSNTLPEDAAAGILLGRAWVPSDIPGPGVVLLRDDKVIDITRSASTMSGLLNEDDLMSRVLVVDGPSLGTIDEVLANTCPDSSDPNVPRFLAPTDLQTIKACGVTFAASMLERVIEEQAKGDPATASEIRKTISTEIGADLSKVNPGSPDAERLKQALIERGLWSQYLEVGIGPYAEVFSKAPPMSAVGTGVEIGLHPESTWNNPEPEVVMVVNARGGIVGATLGNDVNLRDFEGRSALLLGKAKDNNASAAIGPFIRLFDDTFSLDDVRAMDVAMQVEGTDGYSLSDGSSLKHISRDVEDLVRQTIGPNHQYPDGLVLYTGTMFAPTDDRGEAGSGFTHKLGDIVTISTPKLGALRNRVNTSNKADPWTFGIGALMNNLAARGLL